MRCAKDVSDVLPINYSSNLEPQCNERAIFSELQVRCQVLLLVASILE